MKSEPFVSHGSVDRHLRRGARAAVLSALAALALPVAVEAASLGVYSAEKGLFYLARSTEGTANPTPVRIEGARKSWLPVLGIGSFTYGLYDGKTGTFHLRMEESAGPVTRSVRFEGVKKNWLPVAGDWDGDRAYGLGLYDPKTGTFYLKNQLTDGPADLRVRLDDARKYWKPLVGDWDGDGIATIGAYDPRTGRFHLRNANTDGPPEQTIRIQGMKKSLLPVAADWDDDGIWSPGLYSPASGSFYWRNTLDSGPQEGSANLAGVQGNAVPVASSASKAAPTPAATEIGTPTDNAATATIGASGGTLRSPENALLLTIPPGALAADTAITIQPITNHAHGGKGNAFRLTPNGQTFQKPVTLTFSYTDRDLLGTAAEVLGGAYQTPEGYWSWLEGPVVDTSAKTVTITTNHFTDFSVVEGLHLDPGAATVKVNGSVSLAIKACYPAALNAGSSGLLGLPCRVEEEYYVPPFLNVSEWAVNGASGGAPGLGNVSGNRVTATYTAPSKKPTPNVVAVSARIPETERGTLLLVSNITITDDTETHQYKGTVDFALASGLSGHANITWTQFEDLGDVRRYRPTGDIVANFNYENCDPLQVNLPIDTGDTGALVVFNETNKAFPKRYFFGFVGDSSFLATLTCHSGGQTYSAPVLGPGIGIIAAACSSGTPSLEYTDELALSGSLACDTFSVSWSFEGSEVE